MQREGVHEYDNLLYRQQGIHIQTSFQQLGSRAPTVEGSTVYQRRSRILRGPET